MTPITAVNQRQTLDRQADAIERLCRERGAAAHITGGQVTPRYIQFILQPAPTTPRERLEGMSGEISALLHAPARLKYDQALQAVWCEVPRGDPQPIKLSTMLKRLPAHRIPAFTALLGLAADGAPLMIRLPAPDVKHIVISGAAGTGKTVLLQTLVISLAALQTRRALQIVLLGTGLDSLAALSYLNHELNRAGLPGVGALIERRTDSAEPRVMVVVDDLAALTESEQAVIKTLLATGHTKGVHVIGATRETVTTGTDRALVIAADAQPLAVGDFIAYTSAAPLKFAAAYAAPDEIGELVAALGDGR